MSLGENDFYEIFSKNGKQKYYMTALYSDVAYLHDKFSDMQTVQEDMLKSDGVCVGIYNLIIDSAFTFLDSLQYKDDEEKDLYFYHTDHLGSSSFITDINGNITEHLQYLPFGESFVEQKASSHYYTPYKFSGKEKDEETGYSYFGARYLNTDISIWLSVDPMADDNLGISPYNYCHWNPITVIDPDGLDDYGLDETSGRLSLIKITKDKTDFIQTGTFDKDGKFTGNYKGNSFINVSKGILNAKNKQQDLSKEGFSTTGGNQEGGADLMSFISTQTGKELNGKGFETKNGNQELIVGNWDKNTTKKAYPFKFNKEGTITFDIHTHPIGKDGNSGLGHGVAGHGDLDSKAKYPAYYILSERNGLTQYFPALGRGKTEDERFKYTVYPNKNAVPNSLKKYVTK
ncbi:MAG: RHS repeat-associated core domain-containing protein [Bacteroidota bacterium]